MVRLVTSVFLVVSTLALGSQPFDNILKEFEGADHLRLQDISKPGFEYTQPAKCVYEGDTKPEVILGGKLNLYFDDVVNVAYITYGTDKLTLSNAFVLIDRADGDLGFTEIEIIASSTYRTDVQIRAEKAADGKSLIPMFLQTKTQDSKTYRTLCWGDALLPR